LKYQDLLRRLASLWPRRTLPNKRKQHFTALAEFLTFSAILAVAAEPEPEVARAAKKRWSRGRNAGGSVKLPRKRQRIQSQKWRE
jgi:hypothetical protein